MLKEEVISQSQSKGVSPSSKLPDSSQLKDSGFIEDGDDNKNLLAPL
jgi:hypothetical protein